MAVKSKPYTDVIFQGVKLYIEGVQIPFSAISITSGVGVLPTAVITVPPLAGLMDIARFYQPKVHIFFEDRQTSNSSKSDKENYKVLFTGLISQVNYQKSKEGGSSSISFACVHKYALIEECLIDYSGWITGGDLVNNNQGGAIKMALPNSQASVLNSLRGIDLEVTQVATKEDAAAPISSINPIGDVSKVSPDLSPFITRLQGVPGVIVNFWNQMKQAAYSKALTVNGVNQNEAFVKMYEPLLEKGLQFFKRLGGHFPIEARIQASKQQSCPDTPGKSKLILIPPNNRIFLLSSVQADMAIATTQSYLQYSGEMTTIYQIFTSFYKSFDYDILTLSSPAEAPIPPYIELDQPLTASIFAAAQASSITGSKIKTYALDTVVKPRLPFYFSPTCNVLFPGMYTSLSVSYDEANIPTRVDLRYTQAQAQEGKLYFRAPPSIREAIAKATTRVNPNTPYSLLASIGSSHGAVGRYEQGRGVKIERSDFPSWLALYSQSHLGGGGGVTDKYPEAGSDEAEALASLSKGWTARYPGDVNSGMNPYSSKEPGLGAQHRLLFGAADYYYTQAFARSKMGSVECPFNPYITPGYPMDILEANPLHPSFHAMCTTVTHTITAASCNTSVGFTAAMTYSELANYYIPFVNPFLSVSLGLAENPTLISPDKNAYTTAEMYYKYTLGVASIAPSDLVNLNTMSLNPFRPTLDGNWEGGASGALPTYNGGDLNPMNTYEGNLSLTHRPIETQASVEERFTIKFIDMDPSLYNSSVLKYTSKDLATDADKFEIGRSQFLDYNTYFDEPIPVPTVSPGPELPKPLTSTLVPSITSVSVPNIPTP